MSAPYDHEALWLKAKLFLNRAMEDREVRSFDERALWASLSMELLAKSALARQSPLLVAVPTEDGKNVLIALGLIGGEARFTSVPAKTLYSRCERAFKPFSKAEAEKISHSRNEYLHGSAAGFSRLPEEVWWPRFWAQAVILVAASDRDIEDLVGSSRSSAVEAHLAQNASNVQHRTEMLIERARQRKAQYEAGTLQARVAGDWQPGQSVDAGLSYSKPVDCPACAESGRVEGDDVTEVDTQYEQYDEYDYEVIVTLTVDSAYFSCDSCGLALDDYQLLAKAGIEDSFDAEGDPSDVMQDYGND